MTTAPRVLLVNDDGIQAEGLGLLERQVRELTDDVWVVAPQQENSGGGHSVSLDKPLRARQIEDRRYSVSGTPADCVLLAYWELMDRPPDLVFSGINHGENLGEDMTYSGTMGAAMEAAILGVPAVAFSQKRVLGQKPDFTSSEVAGPPLLKQLIDLEWAPGQIVNVNYPAQLADDGRPHVTHLGQRKLGTFTPMGGVDGRNIPYYWVKVRYDPGEPKPGTDLHAVADGRVTVTALSMDLTAPRLNEQLRDHLGSTPGAD
ncbi:5'/3'-nucleotidase SurE [Nocardioides rotundus]|uniref:5'/3'-nucleotidase SurE n=1 Tax=Nocardioides rotundus TaxID=1774216 RepID=UPI001CC075BB|nr:5'/3'-nucleotidase SurE [Nocardioides rotundus]UAL29944.1 5'/3'-nucleotidase SurE [Nocardioides rotundus]